MTAAARRPEVPLARRGRPPRAPHVLSVADLGPEGIAEVLRVAEAFAEVERRSVPKVPDAARQGGGDALLRGVDADPALLRDGGQAAVGRRALARRGQLVGQEGREPARHRRDGRGARHRRRHHPPHFGGGAAPGGALGGTGPRGQRRRRLARAPDPGAASTASRCARSWPSARAPRPRSWVWAASRVCAS